MPNQPDVEPCPWWCDPTVCTWGQVTWGRHMSRLVTVSSPDTVEATVFITLDQFGRPGVAVERDWRRRLALPPDVAEQVCTAVAGFVAELRRGAPIEESSVAH